VEKSDPPLRLTASERRDVDPGHNLLKGTLLLVLLLLLVILLRVTIKDQLEALFQGVLEEYGYPGIFVTVLIMDTLIVPASPDIVIFASIVGDLHVLTSLVLMCTASIIAGQLGYLIGRWLGQIRLVRKFIEPYYNRGHYIAERYGMWAVVAAAFFPIPYSTVSWLAGIFRMRYVEFLAATTWRIPRFLLWYMIIRVGWI